MPGIPAIPGNIPAPWKHSHGLATAREVRRSRVRSTHHVWHHGHAFVVKLESWCKILHDLRGRLTGLLHLLHQLRQPCKVVWLRFVHRDDLLEVLVLLAISTRLNDPPDQLSASHSSFGQAIIRTARSLPWTAETPFRPAIRGTNLHQATEQSIPSTMNHRVSISPTYALADLLHGVVHDVLGQQLRHHAIN